MNFLKQTISLQIFYKLSSTNFTWSILEYFVPYMIHIQSFSFASNFTKLKIQINFRAFLSNTCCYFAINQQISFFSTKTFITIYKLKNT